MSHEVSDRVVQFVLESGAYCAVSDAEGDFTSASSGKHDGKEEGQVAAAGAAAVERLTFYASPEMRTVLKNFLHLSLSELSKGFKRL